MLQRGFDAPTWLPELVSHCSAVISPDGDQSKCMCRSGLKMTQTNGAQDDMSWLFVVIVVVVVVVVERVTSKCK